MFLENTQMVDATKPPLPASINGDPNTFCAPKRRRNNNYVQLELIKNEKVPKPKSLSTQFQDRGEFLAWVREAKPGASCVYFCGELAFFRQWAPMRILKLQSLSDQARPSQPRPPGEAIEIQSLQDRLAIAASASGLMDAGIVHLTQKRSMDAPGALYIATRTGRR